jgi:tetratricopeptide (TPR) repeat protein
MALTKVPENERLRLARGIVLLLEGQDAAALRAWQGVPSVDSFLIGNAQMAWRRQDYANTAWWLGAAAQVAPERAAAVYRRLAKHYFVHADLEQAPGYLEIATELYPNSRQGWVELGNAYYGQGAAEQAIDAWLRGIEATEDATAGVSNLYYQIGLARHRELQPPDYDGAWQAYEAAIQADDFTIPQSHESDVYFQRGHILFRRQQYEQALAEFDEALRRNPNHDSALIWQSATYIQLGDLAKAKESAQRAIALEPTDARGYAALALVYETEGYADDAIENLRKAIQYDPDEQTYRKRLQELEQNNP